MNNLPNNLLQAFLILKGLTDNVYLVGGCVRDMLLGLVPKDYDIVTNVHMDLIEKEFTSNGWKVDATGKQFLVLTISKNGDIYEIANYRKDIGSTDGRRPDSVEIGTLEEDAARRDFTVNAIYWNPFNNQYIFPIKESQEDLSNKVLRFVGKPKDRIKEDYLRLFRFYRFLATKGFNPHKNSLKACREMFNEAYSKTNPERVRNELERMTCLKNL